MKPTGIIRRIDDLGRIVIPRGIRKQLGIQDDDPFEIYVSDGGDVILRKYKTAEELWDEFGDIPMNPETECIETEWHGFPAGTHREEIWHWFERYYDISVHDLMFGE